jgi:HEPN domain-containing protein
VQPALGALSDRRLSEASRHFQKALDDHHAGDPEDAVDEARLSVEAALLALIDARGLDRPDRHQAQALFETLVNEEDGVLHRDAEALVLSAPRFRNQTRAGHTGRRPIGSDESESVIGAAASSLSYLSRLLDA